jgi:hypothetical protein
MIYARRRRRGRRRNAFWRCGRQSRLSSCVRTEYADDDSEIDAARDRQDDTIEDLQRVDAEVEAFFDDQIKKGGA